LAGKIEHDHTGQPLYALSAGPSPYLASRIRQGLGLRCRSIKPDTIQRSSSLAVNEVDRQHAWMVGVAGARAAAEGVTAMMIGLDRRAEGEAWRTTLVPLPEVAGKVRPLPASFVAADSFQMSRAFLDYARPLVGAPLPPPLRW
jgi:ATP-dependent phosphofructokinase / diphosphate-dependent phosphofructokinase